MDKEKVAELFKKADAYATLRDPRRSLTSTEDEPWYMRATFSMPSRFVPWDELTTHEVIQGMIPGPSPAALRLLRQYQAELQESKRLATFEGNKSAMGTLGWGRVVTKPKVQRMRLYLQEDTYLLGLALGAISWHFITVGPKFVFGAFRARKLLMFAGPAILETRSAL